MILRFEPLTGQHIPAILEIESSSNPAPWSEPSFRNELTNPQSVFFVAIADGKIAGYGGSWRCIDEAHITTVAVAPERRREGIGRRLMVELLLRARDEGMVCSTLEVRAGNQAAVQLYEQLGYVVSARRKKYYPDNREDALVMWLHHLDQWAPPRAKATTETEE
jgi:ribosomal-protein-alanine N-acetyltransferase